MKTIITSGFPFTDIDSLASAYAYKDLLIAKGVDCDVILPGSFNKSIPQTVLNWGVNVKKNLTKVDDGCCFVIVDISEKKYFSKFVDENKIIEIYDHHIGYRDQWTNKNIKVKIEEVGACVTLIWEEIKSQNLQNSVSELTAKLIYTAIFSNTLNFNAGVTTERDRVAFEEIQKICGLDQSWIREYYKETEDGILAKPREAISNDTKIIKTKEGKEIAIGQMELWNSRDFVTNNKDLIKDVLSGLVKDNWFMTAPSISEGKNYLYVESEEIKKLLGSITGAKFDGDIGTTDKLWLRKEMLKKFLV